ncbi:helix-turn-helix domain-containing protein [Bradyrhizobium sp. B097]|uniref:IclR family transcriptional regulator n=1 Tax=Bradyrhizobium sp. B097 TaxID=3140244 RepID=UPI003182D091
MTRSIKSAERTLALFELFSRRQHPLTVGRIADELHVPQPSVSMLLANLRKLGYVSYDVRSRTYTPTIRVALLGIWISRKFDAAGSLSSRLAELQRRVDETVFLGIQNGPYAQYLLGIYKKKPRSLRAESGTYRLLTGSAVGRALMSLMTDQEIRSWLHRCNAEAPERRLRFTNGEFMAIISEIRGCGFAQTQGDITPTFGAIAVTVRSPSELMPMAVGTGVPLERIEAKRDDIVEALRDFKKSLESIPTLNPSLDDSASAQPVTSTKLTRSV